jgi:hypothetical protein
MTVGDLVIMPGSCYRDDGMSHAIGVVLKAKPIVAGTKIPRVQVYWVDDAEASWEPREWLEVISESG